MPERTFEMSDHGFTSSIFVRTDVRYCPNGRSADGGVLFITEVRHRRRQGGAVKARDRHSRILAALAREGRVSVTELADAVHDVARAVAEAYQREGFNPPAFLDAVPAAPAGRLA